MKGTLADGDDKAQEERKDRSTQFFDLLPLFFHATARLRKGCRNTRSCFVGAIAVMALLSVLATVRYLATMSVPEETWASPPIKYVWNLGMGMRSDVMVCYSCCSDALKRTLATHPPQNNRYLTVYVCNGMLVRFVDELLPSLSDRKWVLIGGYGTHTMPADLLGPLDRFDKLTTSKGLQAWYTQNVDYGPSATSLTSVTTRVTKSISGNVTRTRVTAVNPQALPLGIDLHTRARRTLFFSGFEAGTSFASVLLSPPWTWVEPASSPHAQVQELETVWRSLPPTSARPLCVFADFQYNAKYGRRYGSAPTRLEAIHSLAGNPWVVWGVGRKQRREIWKEKGSRCAFELSPPGAGMDCHRTWESLILGAIVIMPAHLPPSFQAIFHGLPVVFAEEMSERSINAENLERWRQQFGNASHDWRVRERLTADYWMQRIDESVRLREANSPKRE